MGKTLDISRQLNALSAKKTANKALREVNKLKRAQEVHFKDTADNLACTTSWAQVGSDYLAISEGDGFDERDGNQILVKSVYLKGDIRRPALTVDATGTVARVIMFWDRNATLPAVPNPMKTDDVHSFFDSDYRQNVKVLYDRTFVFGPVEFTTDGVAIGSPNIHSFSKWVKLNKKVSYADASTSSTSGRLCIMQISEGGQLPVTNLNLRVVYIG